MTAYSFQFNLFPVMNSMKSKSNIDGIRSVYYALLMAMGIYITLSVLSIYTFGSSLQADVLDNVNEEVDHEWESMMLRIAFVIVIVCHIPYIFFSAKEAMLIIIDEWDRKSISTSLDKQLLNHNVHQSLDEKGDDATEEKKEEVAYLSMNKTYYYLATILIYLFEIFMATLVKDLGIVFQFAAAISGSSI